MKQVLYTDISDWLQTVPDKIQIVILSLKVPHSPSFFQSGTFSALSDNSDRKPSIINSNVSFRQ